MTPLFKKLNFKNQDKVYILNAPTSFDGEQKDMEPYCKINTTIGDSIDIAFIMLFLREKSELHRLTVRVLPNTIGDAIVWYIYPKKSSKRYTCDFDRDHGWDVLGLMGWESVRMVSIDDDWSALRFRKVEYVKKMTRSFATSEERKEKSKK